MASVKDVEKVADDLEGLVEELRSEVKNGTDFERLMQIGRFQLEAAIQSAHAARRLTGRTDWPAILALYDALHALTGSMVVAINRAVARRTSRVGERRTHSPRAFP